MQSALVTAIMDRVIALSSQNPLSLLVKFGMMAWNNTCGMDNCSGHGECHNGTCLCEVIDPRWFNHFYIKLVISMFPCLHLNNKKAVESQFFVCLSSTCILSTDSIRWNRMPRTKFQLLHRVCDCIFYPGICLSGSIGNVHRSRVAKNEGALVHQGLQSYHPKGPLLRRIFGVYDSRSLLYISGK